MQHNTLATNKTPVTPEVPEPIPTEIPDQPIPEVPISTPPIKEPPGQPQPDGPKKYS